MSHAVGDGPIQCGFRIGKGSVAIHEADISWPVVDFALLIKCIALIAFSIHQPDAIKVAGRWPGAALLLGLFMTTMVITHYLSIQQVVVAYMIAIKRNSLLFRILYGGKSHG